MKVIMASILGSYAAFVFLAAEPSAQTTPSQPSFSKEDIDRNCIISAGDKLRQLTGLSATAGRALPLVVEGQGVKPDDRLVELDATNVGMKVTYVFMCLKLGSEFDAEPMGHR